MGERKYSHQIHSVEMKRSSAYSVIGYRRIQRDLLQHWMPTLLDGQRVCEFWSHFFLPPPPPLLPSFPLLPLPPSSVPPSAVSGVIITLTTLDFEMQQTYQLRVRATDMGTPPQTSALP